MRTELLIIGGGPAGITAAHTARQLRIPHVLIDAGPTLGGQLLHCHHVIEDYPGLMLLGPQMATRFAEGILPVLARVDAIDVINKTVTANAVRYQANTLLLAMGARQRGLGVEGEAPWLRPPHIPGLPTDVRPGERVIVIGGGDNASDAAISAAQQGGHVQILIRSARMRARFVPDVAIDNVEIVKIEGADVITKTKRYQGDRVLIRIGYAPNTELLQGQVPLDAQGYVTSTPPGVFAVGDIVPGQHSILAACAQALNAVKQI